jgi:tetratricopeptide (TPR) repeat protein
MILIRLGAFFLMMLPVCSAFAIHLQPGEFAPDIALRSIDGRKISLNAYEGNIVVLTYWKTGQDYSLMALEDCRKMFNSYKDRGVQFISVIAGSENMENVHRIIKHNKINFPVLIDSDRKVYGAYGIRVYPTTVIIDGKGKIVYDLPGHAVIYSSILEGYLRYLLGEMDYADLQEIISPQKHARPESVGVGEKQYNLALEFAERGFIRQAQDMALKSVESNPGDSRAHILLGYLLLQSEEQEQAVKEFHKALELDPLSFDAKTGLGKAYIMRGELDVAINILQEAVINNPHPQFTYYMLGKAYELKNDQNRAIELYKRVLDEVMCWQFSTFSLKEQTQ